MGLLVLVLQQRYCACGCGNTFRVMPTNCLNYFAAVSHAERVVLESTKRRPHPALEQAEEFLRACDNAAGGSMNRRRGLKLDKFDGQFDPKYGQPWEGVFV